MTPHERYLLNREKIITRSAQWQKEHPERTRELRNLRRKRNIDRTREIRREWAKNNPDKVRRYAKKCDQSPERRRKHILACREWERNHKEEKIVRSAIWRMLGKRGVSKTSRSWSYIGCSQGFLKNHLEAQFLPGMTWENYGEWHVDHTIPLSWWDVDKHPEHAFVASHWTNLKPMWGSENMKKGARFAA